MAIVRTGGICGGDYRIEGTRITVQWIKDYLKSFDNLEEGIQELVEDYKLIPEEIYEAQNFIPPKEYVLTEEDERAIDKAVTNYWENYPKDSKPIEFTDENGNKTTNLMDFYK